MKLISRIAINALIAMGLSFSISFAQISALDSIEENTIGFALNGKAKGGILSSTLSSELLPDGEDVSEYSAFSDFLLNISIRPSNETRATFDLRFHKDWQSAYREGANTPIIRWWSYDGNILDKKLKFNLGTIRLAYTPLTVYLPEPELIMEPEIFASLKKDAMEERYLDGTNRRLLQGLNVEYAMSAGIFDRIFVQGTIVRLRKVADGTDRIFFDFDPNKDRFSAGARIGVETYGVRFGINEVYTFNRFSSAMLDKKSSTADTLVNYEQNSVLSFELNYDSKKSLEGPLTFGIGAEYASSDWNHWQHKKVPADSVRIVNIFTINNKIPSIIAPDVVRVTGSSATVNNSYPYYATVAPSYKQYKHELSMVEELSGKGALLGSAYISYKEEPFEVKVSGHFLSTDKDFESELAASPAYLPNLPILNSYAMENNLKQFRTGSLENMYYSLYYTLPMNLMTVVNGEQGKPNDFCKGLNDRLYQATCLDNNYKLAPYYRNAYTQQTYTRLERQDSSVASRLDPSISLVLPNGYATPDRFGGDGDLNFVWNKAVTLRGVGGMYYSEKDYFTRLGAGLEVDVARLAGLEKTLIVSGSYEQNKEETIIQTDRIMAGLKVGIWRGLSLIGGFHQLSKEFQAPYFSIDKVGELLLIGGPHIKISEKAEFALQVGSLSNSIESKGEKYDLDKFIMSGLVTVEF